MRNSKYKTYQNLSYKTEFDRPFVYLLEVKVYALKVYTLSITL